MLLYVFGLINEAHALTGNAGLFDPLSGCDLPCITGKIIQILTVVGAPIASIMVLWGGYQIMTAAGDPEKFKTGRHTILYAAIGLVVLLVANSVPALIQGIFK